MIKKIDHIGIAVKDIDSALKFYRDSLGLECTHVEEVEDQKVKIAFIPVGEVNLELAAATDSESAIAKFIEKKGEGIQHIAFSVEKIEDVLESLKGKGVELIDSVPRAGAHGSKIAFIHPRSTNGALIELCQR